MEQHIISHNTAQPKQLPGIISHSGGEEERSSAALHWKLVMTKSALLISNLHTSLNFISGLFYGCIFIVTEENAQKLILRITLK